MLELDYTAIGARIAALRRAQGINAAELAEMVGGGLTRDVLANIETGRRSNLDVGVLASIALQLDVPLLSLLFDLRHPGDHVSLDGQPWPVDLVVAWLSGWDQQGDERTDEQRILLGISHLRDRQQAFLRAVQSAVAEMKADPDADDDVVQGRWARANQIERELASVRDTLEVLGVEFPPPKTPEDLSG